MKKMIILVGCIVMLSGVTVAETTLSIEAKVDKKIETTTDRARWCDPLMQFLGMCKSSKKLPTDYQ